MATTSELPLEIIEIMLLKLSCAKSLLRFKSVSKSWHALISDLVLLCNFSSRHKFSSSDNLSFVKLEGGKLQTLEEKIKGIPRSLNDVVCFGDGVLLLTNTSLSRHVLFNPSTRALTDLGNQYNIHRFTCGLCRDPTTGDFKVVLIDTRSCYVVYSCKNKSWTYRDPLNTCFPVYWKSGVSVDGAIYWVWRHNNNVAKVIRYFDPRDDTLKILPKPKDVDDEKDISLVNLRSSLCLYCSEEHTSTVRIWTKEKGIDNQSWKELMTIHNVLILVYFFEPQCFLGDKVLIQNNEQFKLEVYSPSEEIFEQFGDIKLYGLGLIPYMDFILTHLKHQTKEEAKGSILK